LRRLVVSVWMVLLASSLVACSDDAEPTRGTDAGSDAENDSEATVECLLQDDGTCPEGCSENRGRPWDEENQCQQ